MYKRQDCDCLHCGVPCRCGWGQAYIDACAHLYEAHDNRQLVHLLRAAAVHAVRQMGLPCTLSTAGDAAGWPELPVDFFDEPREAHGHERLGFLDARRLLPRDGGRLAEWEDELQEQMEEMDEEVREMYEALMRLPWILRGGIIGAVVAMECLAVVFLVVAFFSSAAV